MNFRVNTIEEAWKFLIEEVYHGGGSESPQQFESAHKGEFRIHSNKDGIRLYLRFANPVYTGKIFRYYTGLGFAFHRALSKIVPNGYCDTIVKADLVTALNAHLHRMPGYELVDDSYVVNQGKDMTELMTWQEFILEDLKQRNQEFRYEQEIQRCKEFYNL